MGSAEPRRWRGRLLAILAVVVPAVFLRACVVGTYVVTSPSMHPALQVDDRLLAWRDTWLDAPRAWDLVLVDPGVDGEAADVDTDALVKRVVSAPRDRPEFVSLRGGDVWAGPTEDALSLRARPPALRDAMLVPVDERRTVGAPWIGHGVVAGTSGGWRLGESGPAELRFGRAVRDGDLEEPGHEVVHDTALELELAAAPRAGRLTLRLREGADVYSALLAFGPEGVDVVLGHNLGDTSRQARLAPPPAAGTRLRFLNVDDHVELQVDGRTLVGGAVPPAQPLPPGATLNNEPTFAWEGGVLELARLTVLRDVHYTAQGRYASSAEGGFGSCQVFPGELFLLGDDSRRSRDSRHFDAVDAEAVLGRPFATYGPAGRRRSMGRQGL